MPTGSLCSLQVYTYRHSAPLCSLQVLGIPCPLASADNCNHTPTAPFLPCKHLHSQANLPFLTSGDTYTDGHTAILSSAGR